MIGQRQEAPVELALFARVYGIEYRLEVGVNQARRHPTEEGEGTAMGIEHHFLHFSGVGHDKHLAAIGHTEVCHFDSLKHPTQLDLLLAPVKLAGIARLKLQL